MILFNSAAALAMGSGDFQASLDEAERSLSSGAALEKLEKLVAFSQKLVAGQEVAGQAPAAPVRLQ